MNYSEKVLNRENPFKYVPIKQINIYADGKNVFQTLNDSGTTITENVEPTDPDEITLMSTTITKTVEPYDPDEVLI
jgi:hypothetical protein